VEESREKRLKVVLEGKSHCRNNPVITSNCPYVIEVHISVPHSLNSINEISVTCISYKLHFTAMFLLLEYETVVNERH
jgi:IMP cyclohydrolase